jgi:SOS-response transcriptional repressor LexA
MMEPEFEHGCVIIVDPEGLVKDGCFVVARHNEEFFFRQLVIDGDRYLLKCVNHAYDEVVELNGLSSIHGVVAQKAGTRRKDRKRYD